MSLLGAQRTLGGKEPEDRDLGSNGQTPRAGELPGSRLRAWGGVGGLQSRKDLEMDLWCHPGLHLSDVTLGFISMKLILHV